MHCPVTLIVLALTTLGLCGTFANGASVLPPRPVVPCDVSAVGLPVTSGSIYFNNTVQDYIGLKVTCFETSSVLENLECFTSKRRSDSAIHNRNIDFEDGHCLGIRDIHGNVFQSYSFTCTNAGYSPGTVLLDPVYYKHTVQGTYVKEQDYWSLVQQAFVPANTPHKMEVIESYGVSQTSASALSDSVGVSTQDSWSNNFGGYTKDMSSSLTEIFAHQTTIDESVTIDETFYFNATVAEQVDGVYQLVQFYQTIPSISLQQAITKNNAQNHDDCDSFLHDRCYSFSLPVTYRYSANTYLQVAGTDRPC